MLRQIICIIQFKILKSLLIMDCSHQLVDSGPIVAAQAENDQIVELQDQSQQEFFSAQQDAKSHAAA